MSNNNFKQAWEISYIHKDNFVFYPHEEIIRFSAKYVVKRIGLNEFQYKVNDPKGVKVLDLGCGIGRHFIFFEKMNIKTYGIDLSSEAINIAKQWAQQECVPDNDAKLRQGDITRLPWENEFFDFIVSHGVLDSVPFTEAKKGVIEASRVLKGKGLFYCDLISSGEYSGEDVVKTDHEKDTIQSYFNYSKVLELVGDYFEIEECKLIKNENCLSGNHDSRYHLVLRKKGKR